MINFNKLKESPLTYMALGTIMTLGGMALERMNNDADWKILVATESATAPFDHSLVLVRQGWFDSMGVILNKPLPESFAVMLPEQLKPHKDAISYGGSVGAMKTNKECYTLTYEISDKEQIINISPWQDVLKKYPDALKLMGSAAPTLPRFRIFCGLSTWGFRQLRSEIKASVWKTTSVTEELALLPTNEADWQKLNQELSNSDAAAPRNAL